MWHSHVPNQIIDTSELPLGFLLWRVVCRACFIETQSGIQSCLDDMGADSVVKARVLATFSVYSKLLADDSRGWWMVDGQLFAAGEVQ